MSVSATDQKQEQIIEAALKRFAHFGVAKTTMSEIADDLSLSKASLYYYFPDKTALVLAVGENILSVFLDEQSKALANAQSFEEGINAIIEVRICFGRKYFMMHIGDGQSDVNTADPKFKTALDHLKQTELDMMAAYIRQYQKEKVLKDVDAKETAEVLLDVLVGLWIAEIHIHQKSFVPTNELFERIRTKTKRMVSIFCDGIKRN
ncbi:hypothetical protein BCY91_10320 [Pelobium manganitolerans]|uniref:HTH tetR-type domain-containing protein n=1 Tax=Pelobium manganitolerans TaxID=1842495 RepID=A0A419S2L0_9SPHI|nr:TetR/AcrR family transcriptional regulator [Pelobium manganitolerans]RKD13210.1 hypothetical protein BCY91_10320 [Pelobium manganitolerans]